MGGVLFRRSFCAKDNRNECQIEPKQLYVRIFKAHVQELLKLGDCTYVVSLQDIDCVCVENSVIVSTSLDGDIRVWDGSPGKRHCVRTINRRWVCLSLSLSHTPTHTHTHTHISKAYHSVITDFIIIIFFL